MKAAVILAAIGLAAARTERCVGAVGGCAARVRRGDDAVRSRAECAAADFAPFPRAPPPAAFPRSFADWAAKHGKRYASPEEMKLRR